MQLMSRRLALVIPLLTVLLMIFGCSTRGEPKATDGTSIFNPTPVAAPTVATGGKIKVTRVYTGKDGNSHFEDLYLSPSQTNLPLPKIWLSTASIPAKELYFSTFVRNFFWDWHNPPGNSRYLTAILQGVQRIETSDGMVRTFYPNDILLFEDSIGHGHRAWGLSNGTELTIKLS